MASPFDISFYDDKENQVNIGLSVATVGLTVINWAINKFNFNKVKDAQLPHVIANSLEIAGLMGISFGNVMDCSELTHIGTALSALGVIIESAIFAKNIQQRCSELTGNSKASNFGFFANDKKQPLNPDKQDQPENQV